MPGHKDIQDSYQAELGGLYSAIIMIHLIQTIHNLPQANIKIACNGLQALINTFHTRHLQPSQSQYDLLTCIRRQLCNSPMTWSPHYVEGHTNKNGHVMDWWEQCNDKMDCAAKAHHQQTQNLTQPDPSLPLSRYEGWRFFHNNRHLTRIQIEHVYDNIYAPIAKTYWVRGKHIQPLAKRKIYWVGMKNASSQLRPGKGHWMVKHVTEICSVGKRMKKWKYWQDDRCPQCNQRKDIPHITRCTHRPRKQNLVLCHELPLHLAP
jgi:hypothetical protein